MKSRGGLAGTRGKVKGGVPARKREPARKKRDLKNAWDKPSGVVQKGGRVSKG